MLGSSQLQESLSKNSFKGQSQGLTSFVPLSPQNHCLMSSITNTVVFLIISPFLSFREGGVNPVPVILLGCKQKYFKIL